MDITRPQGLSRIKLRRILSPQINTYKENNTQSFSKKPIHRTFFSKQATIDFGSILKESSKTKPTNLANKLARQQNAKTNFEEKLPIFSSFSKQPLINSPIDSNSPLLQTSSSNPPPIKLPSEPSEPNPPNFPSSTRKLSPFPQKPQSIFKSFGGGDTLLHNRTKPFKDLPGCFHRPKTSSQKYREVPSLSFNEMRAKKGTQPASPFRSASTKNENRAGHSGLGVPKTSSPFLPKERQISKPSLSQRIKSLSTNSDHPPPEVSLMLLNFVKLTSAGLATAQTKLSNGQEASKEVQEFLERFRMLPELEKRMKNSIGPGIASVLQLQNLSLFVILFAVNYVNIQSFNSNVISILEEFLSSFFLSVSFLKTLELPQVFSPEDSDIGKIVSVFPEKNLKSTFPHKIVLSLRTSIDSAKKSLLKLLAKIYKNSKVFEKIEKLAMDAEILPCFEFQMSSFNLFEKILKETVEDPPEEPFMPQKNPSCLSLSFESQESNFVLQPTLSISEKLLPPFSHSSRKLTLVLDLDETLVHFEDNPSGGEFLVRPYASEFLEHMSRVFEIVIFTAALKEYADWIIDRIDLTGWISHRLYREHTQSQSGIFLKDLSRLGRDLSSIIIVDNNAENFQLQPENGICIKTWHNDPNDNALFQLMKLLLYVAEKNTGDVRGFLKNIQKMKSKKVREGSSNVLFTE